MAPHLRSRGLLALAAWTVAAAALSGCGAGGPRRPNVILFVVDTLRADRLGCYGNPSRPSPILDAFAEQGILFENAFAPSPYTATSHASLFTSLYPAVHGVWNRLVLKSGHTTYPALAENAVTLAEVFRDAGYQTAAIADGGYVNERRGLSQGFDLFESTTRWVRDRMARGRRWLQEERDPERPFFLFLHTYEVHYPYLPEEPFVQRFGGAYQGPLRDAVRAARDYAPTVTGENPIGEVQRKFFKPLFDGEMKPEDVEFVRGLYDAEIAMVDEEFARLLALLEAQELMDDTILIVTSDHGEQLWEHGEFGHHQVWEEQLRIPFLIRLPGGPRGVRRQDSIDLVDVMPTLLQEIGLPVPEAAMGAAIELRREPRTPEIRRHVSQANYPKDITAYRRGPWKTLLYPDQPRPPQTFHLLRDPGERLDLYPTEEGGSFAGEAIAYLPSFLDAGAELRKRLSLEPTIHSLESFTPQSITELETLGYAGGGEDEDQ